jgi:hypothetical protein
MKSSKIASDRRSIRMKNVMKPFVCMFLFTSMQLHAQGNYPLEIGNWWDFWVIVTTLPPVPAYVTRVDRDTVMSNGMVYRVLEGGDSAWWSPKFLRQQGSVVREYRTEIGAEFVLCDFSALVGDTVEIRRYPTGDSSTVILMYAGYSNVFGRSRFTQRYKEVFFSTPWYPNSWEVVDSIGLYHMGIGGYPPSFAAIFFFLYGAVIRGVPIGTVSVDLSETHPQNFVLYQNYPNPFNPSTTIKFALPKASHVLLKVYNLLGQDVATLVNETLGPGTYERTFNAGGLASGVYLYRLQSGEFLTTKKLIMMR